MRTLRDVRVDRLYSIRGLARAAGISPASVLDAEAGKRLPRLDTIRKLAATLEVDPSAVVEFAAAIEAARAGRRGQSADQVDPQGKVAA